MSVPVISEKGQPLFPTSERRARSLLQKGSAKKYWQKGIFCIRLVRTETEKREEYPDVAVASDPGSKREGYTVLTPKSVVLNITTNTPSWVKDHVETRRNLRRNRRQRKAPYRACRENRSTLRNENRVPPSTKARWDCKLRILKLLFRILPITLANIEDIKAETKKGKKQWNASFSPLEVGKQYFAEQFKQLFPHVKLVKTAGHETAKYRSTRGFEKSKNKLEYIWEAHNVDSHSLAEMVLGKAVRPHKSMYKIQFLEYHRRSLHRQNFSKGHKRGPYGSTVSCGLSRGSVVVDIGDKKMYYIGGSSRDGFVSIHDMDSLKRVKQFKKITELRVLYCTKSVAQFLHGYKTRGILAER